MDSSNQQNHDERPAQAFAEGKYHSSNYNQALTRALANGYTQEQLDACLDELNDARTNHPEQLAMLDGPWHRFSLMVGLTALPEPEPSMEADAAEYFTNAMNRDD